MTVPLDGPELRLTGWSSNAECEVSDVAGSAREEDVDGKQLEAAEFADFSTPREI
ncbi:hypothetical protein FRC12_024207 [Ceratobasidium sp. 428]|nr:hypothetical protein FRC12_024207 [Ceratobasidium sp. 428]